MTQFTKQMAAASTNQVRIPILESTKDVYVREFMENKQKQANYQSTAIATGVASFLMFVIMYIVDKTTDYSWIQCFLKLGLTAGGVVTALVSVANIIEAQDYRKSSKHNKREIDEIQSEINRLKNEINAYNAEKMKILTR